LNENNEITLVLNENTENTTSTIIIFRWLVCVSGFVSGVNVACLFSVWLCLLSSWRPGLHC